MGVAFPHDMLGPELPIRFDPALCGNHGSLEIVLSMRTWMAVRLSTMAAAGVAGCHLGSRASSMRRGERAPAFPLWHGAIAVRRTCCVAGGGVCCCGPWPCRETVRSRAFAPSGQVEDRIRAPERQPGRKTLEVEILGEGARQAALTKLR